MFLVDDEKKSAWEIAAENVRRLMGQQTQKAFGRKCGVSQTAVGYLLRPGNKQMKSPKLITLEKIADKHNLATWQLLVDPETFGPELAQAMQRPAIGDTNTKLQGWSAKSKAEAPETAKATTSGKRR